MFRGVVVQLVRTLACHARGREFESRRPRHFPSPDHTPLITPRAARCGLGLASVVLIALTMACARPIDAGQGRTGAVRLDAGRFVDKGGAWPALGTSLFWALWGERNDPERLEANLAFAASIGVDYIRILSMVGTQSWHDRVIDPAATDYWEIVDRLAGRAARHGLRLQVTIFADAQVMMPDNAAREQWVDAWARRASQSPERFILLEVANEYWQNGFDTPAEVARLARRLQAATDVLVAPSAPRCGAYPADLSTPEAEDCVAEWRTLHADEVADVATPHFDRDISGPLGPMGPVCGPLSMRRVPADVVSAFINNEPIGPQSSVVSDTDASHLSAAAAVTWGAGGAGYTLHTGAGVRGGGVFDTERGRSANLWDVPNVRDTFEAINVVRTSPPDQSSWIARCRQ